jgi:hypothetical protein
MLKPRFEKSTSSGFFLFIETNTTIKEFLEGRLICYCGKENHFSKVQEVWDHFLAIEEENQRRIISKLLSAPHLGKDKLKSDIKSIPGSHRIYDEESKEHNSDENSPLLNGSNHVPQN